MAKNSVKVLYDYQHEGFINPVNFHSRRISENSDINIYMSFCNGFELIEKISANPNFDMVILHLGTNDTGAYNQTEKIRGMYNGLLVAESVMFPNNKQEVLQHFDDYTYLIADKDCFVGLLKKYGHLPEIFKI